MTELATPLPPATGDDVPGDLWMFVAAGQWQLLGAIEVTTKGIERWKERALSDGIEISWEAGIQPGWSYVFPRNICPDDFLILLD